MIRWSPAFAAFVVLCLCAVPLPVDAQSFSLNGRAVDTAGSPLAGIEILMHRVDGRGGSRLGAATTNADGGFTFSAEMSDDTAAVYFAATRYDEQLFIGPFVRPPFDDAEPYVLVVGGQPVDLGTPVPTGLPPVSPGPGPRRKALVLLPLIGLMGVAAWAVVRITSAPPSRRMLLRVATIDEQLAGTEPDPQLDRERERLMERLLAD